MEQLIVLTYHIISDSSVDYVDHVIPKYGTDIFKEHISQLRKHFHFINYQTLHDSVINRKILNRPSCLLTFDDGYSHCFNLCKEILEPLKVPALFFLTKNFIDNKHLFYRNKISLCIEHLKHADDNLLLAAEVLGIDYQYNLAEKVKMKLLSLPGRNAEQIDQVFKIFGFDERLFLQKNRPYLTAEQVCTLSQNGFTFGAHGCNHRRYNEFETHSEMIDDYTSSVDFVSQLTKQHHVPFSFPFHGDKLAHKIVSAAAQESSGNGLIFDCGIPLGLNGTIINRIWAEHPGYIHLDGKAFVNNIRRTWFISRNSITRH